jgi:hypothetical protein
LYIPVGAAARVDGVLAPEVIDERLIGGMLVQISEQSVGADPQIAMPGLGDRRPVRESVNSR